MDIDEKYYLLALRHLQSDQRNEALWTKALTQADGDAAKARYRYVALLVERIAANRGPAMVSGDQHQGNAGAPVAGGVDRDRFDDPRLREVEPDASQAAPLDLSAVTGDIALSVPPPGPDWPLLNRVDDGDGGKALSRSDALALSASTVQLIYYFYLIGLFALGIPLVIGVILAYSQKGDDQVPGWLHTHCRFLIVMFWAGVGSIVLAAVVGALSLLAAVAFLVIVSMAIVVVLARGLQALQRGEPAPYMSTDTGG